MKYLLLFSTSMMFACTDFLLKDVHGDVVVGRSMEYAIPMHSQIEFYYKGRELMSPIEGGKEGMKWKVKYDFMGINCFNSPILCDGMNDVGLSVEILYFPKATYPKYENANPEITLAMEDIPLWLLSSFATTEEVRSALPKVHIWAHSLPQFGGEPQVHVAIHDRTGKTIVIEFIDGGNGDI